jgi:hypothetical protein
MNLIRSGQKIKNNNEFGGGVGCLSACLAACHAANS